jgi:hypothetical protein
MRAQRLGRSGAMQCISFPGSAHVYATQKDQLVSKIQALSKVFLFQAFNRNAQPLRSIEGNWLVLGVSSSFEIAGAARREALFR